MTIVLIFLFSYVLLGLASEWIPHAASWWRKSPPKRSEKADLMFAVVAPCHNAAHAIAAFVKCIRAQTYPAKLVRLVLLLDNCSDESRQVAAAAGVDIFVRTDLHNKGKGAALNALFKKRLQHEWFDAVVLFDIDADVEPDFLRKAAMHLSAGKLLVQGATAPKNSDVSEMTFIGSLIQDVIRTHQEDRSLIGWPPLLIGSHGLAFRREVLDRLEWRISTCLTAMIWNWEFAAA